MAQEWFYTKDGKSKLGPVSSADLQALAKSGQLLPTDMVWREGIGQWTTANKIKGLFANSQSTMKASPPPLAIPPHVPPRAVTPPSVPVRPAHTPTASDPGLNRSSTGGLWGQLSTRAKVGIIGGGAGVLLLLLLVMFLVVFGGGPGGSGGDSGTELEGTWKVTRITTDNKVQDVPPDKDFKLVFEGNTMFYVFGGEVGVQEATFQIDPGRNPKTIDITSAFQAGDKHVSAGIYLLEGDSLKIGTSLDERGSTSKRPADFHEPGTVVLEARRVWTIGSTDVAALREKAAAQRERSRKAQKERDEEKWKDLAKRIIGKWQVKWKGTEWPLEREFVQFKSDGTILLKLKRDLAPVPDPGKTKEPPPGGGPLPPNDQQMWLGDTGNYALKKGLLRINWGYGPITEISISITARPNGDEMEWLQKVDGDPVHKNNGLGEVKEKPVRHILTWTRLK